MNLYKLQAQIQELIDLGYGLHEVIVTNTSSGDSYELSSVGTPRTIEDDDQGYLEELREEEAFTEYVPLYV